MTHPSEQALRDLLDQIKAATREAHEAMAGLRQARAEAEAWITDDKHEVRARVHKQIEDQVTSELAEFKKANLRAIKEAERRIDRRFDVITDLMTGKDRDIPMDVVAARLGAAIDNTIVKANDHRIPAALRRGRS